MLWLLGCAGQPVDSAQPAPLVLPMVGQPTNLLVISVDTLRRDRVSGLGYGVRSTTPTLDALLDQGFVLENHRSCSSWTLPSFVCLMTGQDQLELGAWPASTGDGPPEPVSQDLVLLSEQLSDRGFHTMLASASGFMGQAADMNQGIDRGWGAFYDDEGEHRTGDVITKEALALLSTVPPDKPWYLHAHYLDPHMPYDPPQEYLGALEGLAEASFDLSGTEGTQALWREFSGLDPDAQALHLEHLAVRYDAALRYTDDQLAELLGAIGPDTLVVVVSDHGEEFQDHGGWNHGSTAYDEVNRSLVVFWGPGLVAPGRCQDPTQHQDVLDLLAPAFSLDSPGERSDGSTLTWLGPRSVQSVLVGDRKLVYTWTGEKELYDLAVDPGEQEDLYTPDAAEDLWERLLPKVQQVAEAEGLSPVDAGP